MAENVVNIGDFSIARLGRGDACDKKKCRHFFVELNDHGETVTCRDCGVPVSAYWALCNLAEYWEAGHRKLRNEQERLQQEKNAHVHLTAARVVEKAWRNRSMVPTCPHCGEGISAHDRFGHSFISKRIDEHRRKARGGLRND